MNSVRLAGMIDGLGEAMMRYSLFGLGVAAALCCFAGSALTKDRAPNPHSCPQIVHYGFFFTTHSDICLADYEGFSSDALRKARGGGTGPQPSYTPAPPPK